jgi:hypothetical protein
MPTERTALIHGISFNLLITLGDILGPVWDEEINE